MDILEKVQEKFGGRRYEHYVAINCPYHSDSHPSMIVHEDGYRCLSCGKRGRTTELLGVRAVAVPPSPQYWAPHPADMNDFVNVAHRFLRDNPQFRDYYTDRKVGGFIETGRLGFWDGWYVIPVIDIDNSVIQILYRASHYIQEATDQRYMMNGFPVMYTPDWSALLTARRIYVTFGVFDAMTLTLCGYPAVSSIGGKDTFNAEWLVNFRCPIYIVPDKGEEDSATRLANELGWRGSVFHLGYPKGCKDPNEYYISDEERFLKELIQTEGD